MKIASRKVFKYNSYFYIAGRCALVVVAVYFLVSFLKFGGSQTQSVTVENSQQNGQISSSQIAIDFRSGGTSSAVAVFSGSVFDPQRVKYSVDHFDKIGLQTLEFSAFDEQGNPYTPDNLLTFHEKKFHFFVVSADLRDFQHVHPDFVNGKWKVPVYLPNPGTYYTYLDITPVKGNPIVLRANLVVQKETTGTIDYPGVTPGLFAITNGYKAALNIVSPEVLKISELAFLVTKDEKPVTISEYLAAEAHFFILRQGDPDSVMHVHPLSSDPTSGKASFQIVFRQAGRYTVFAQFGIGPEVFAFPITFDINS